MSDLTVEILKQIRDELKTTREELSGKIGETNSRLDVTNERLDRLEHRQAESEIRMATELTAIVGVVRELRDVILEDRRLREQVTDHEKRIGALEHSHSGH